MTKSILRKSGHFALGALAASFLIWGVSHALASGNDGSRAAQNSAAAPIPQGSISPTPTPTPSPSPSPSATPNLEINGQGEFTGPTGGRAQFFIVDVENEQITQKYLEGGFAYSDHRSRVSFITEKIQTVTINGNQAGFTGIATIGGKNHRQNVQFIVSVTANQDPSTGDSFSISLSNGYAASGNLTSGSISITLRDPD